MSSTQRGKILLLALLTMVAACTTKEEEPLPPVEWSSARQEIRARVLERARGQQLARADGWVYTVDVGQLLEAAALLRDRELYETMLPIAARARVDWSDNPYWRGFVAWRVHPSEPPDATGTTEALRLARGLWLGSTAFDRPGDRTAAVEIVDGYRRHEYVDQGVWLIRNYYNLQTDAFASNSFLVDYDPDFVREVARATDAFGELSRKVDRLVHDAVTALGLVHELVQPEILTALPTLGTAIFSPNRMAKLSNSCAVLERSLGSERESAEKLLRFAHQRAEGLGLIFDVVTGDRHPDGYAGVETYGCLTRLAHALKLPELAEPFDRKLDWFIRDFLDHEKQPFAFVASELLLTAAAIERSRS